MSNKLNIFSILVFLGVFVLFACSNGQKKTSSSDSNNETDSLSASVELVKKWESDTTMITCESVLFSEKENVLFVSNIDGNPMDDDGNGFISKVSLDGEVLNLNFVSGLNAPKGMGENQETGKLYVSDINRIVEIEMASGEIIASYDVPGAGFLNDVSLDKNGDVYFSDSSTGIIHILSDGKINTWVQDTSMLKGPNGLFVEDDRILNISFQTGELFSIDKNTKEISKLADGLGGGDGIVPDGEGNYLVSNWYGQVFILDKDWNKEQILDTRAFAYYAADIEYIPSAKLLLVPTFFMNRVVAYELK